MTQAVKLSGFAELEAQLAEMPARMARGATRRAVTRASEVIADDMRLRAPGDLPGTITVKVRTRNLTGLAEYSAALAGGGDYGAARGELRAARRERGSEGTRMFSIIGSTAPHAHLVERGTVERFHKSGKSTGIMPMNPFVRPAFDTKKEAALDVLKRELVVEIGRIKGRLAKRAARAARN